MPSWTDLFVRDSLSDNGTVPSPGYACNSPDVIGTQQTTYPNPSQTFGLPASWAADPNQVLVAQQNNYFYVRAQNKASAPRGGQAYVYWSKASLLLTPDLWFNQPLMVSINNQWQANNPLPSVAPNAISVSQQPYAWTPPTLPANDHFCLIYAVSTPQHPWPPPTQPTFPGWDSFVMWLRNHRDIASRNLRLVSNPNAPEWDRVDGLHNRWKVDTPLLVSATCDNVPRDTQITLRCDALGINTTAPITNATQQVVFAQGVTCPANFNGAIETIAQLPGRGRWPSGARIKTTAYFGTHGSSDVAQFGVDFGADRDHPGVRAALDLAGGDDAALVEIGTCTTAYTGVSTGLDG